MSGRPVLTQIRWATAESNYPAGGNAWNGQPIRVTPVADYSTPNTLLPAENFNSQIGTMSDDAYAMLTLLGQGPALNWNLSFVEGTGVRRAAFDDSTGSWYGVRDGTTDKLYQTFDSGQSWAQVVTSATGSLYWPAIGVNGRLVVTQTNVNVSYYDGTWHQVSSALGGTVNVPRCFYEPVNSVFGIFYYDSGGTKFRLYKSTNMSTWTEVTSGAPSYFTTPVGSGTLPKMGVGAGVWCMAYPQLAGKIFAVATWNPANTTWSSPGGFSLVALTTFTDMSDPIYSAVDGVWMIAAYGNISGIAATEIWTAQDGVIWTHTKTLTGTIAIKQLACLGSLWTGLSLTGKLILSIDKGATWYPATSVVFDPTSTASFLWAGGGGFLYLETGGSSDSARASLRFDVPSVALT